MKKITDYPIIGYTKKNLILQIEEKEVFCSFINYGFFAIDSRRPYKIDLIKGCHDDNGKYHSSHYVINRYRSSGKLIREEKIIKL